MGCYNGKDPTLHEVTENRVAFRDVKPRLRLVSFELCYSASTSRASSKKPNLESSRGSKVAPHFL